MIRQDGVTVILPVQPGSEAALAQEIHNLDQLMQANRRQNFPAMSSLHFMAIAIIPGKTTGIRGATDPITAQRLMIEINFDGKLESFLQTLWGTHQNTMCAILRLCSTPTPTNYRSFRKLIYKFDRGFNTFFKALPGVTVDMIEKSASLYTYCKNTALQTRNSPDPEISSSHHQNPKKYCEYLENEVRGNQAANTSLFDVNNIWPREFTKALMPGVLSIITFLITIIALAGSGFGMPIENDQAPFKLFFTFLTLLVLALLFIFVLLKFFGDLSATTKASASTKEASKYAIPFSLFVSTAFIALAATPLIVIVMSINESWTLILYFGLILIWIFWRANAFLAIPGSASLDRFVNSIVHGIFLYPLILLGLQFIDIPHLSNAARLLSSTIVFFVILYLLSTPKILAAKMGILSAVIIWVAFPIVPQGMIGLVGQVAYSTILLVLYFYAHWICKIESLEKDDFEYPPFWPPGPIRDQVVLQECQNQQTQNHLLSYTKVKDTGISKFRVRTIKMVLFAIEHIDRLFGERAKLAGISTIHFARWVVLDDANLLFVTNYSGTWDAYLDEFIDEAHIGISAIWSNTHGFPRTRWLLNDGAELEQQFKMFARRSQLPTLLHYSAYPNLSIKQIQRNLLLNELLQKSDRTDAECEKIVRML